MFLFGVYYSVSGPFFIFAAGKFCFYLFLACPFFFITFRTRSSLKLFFVGGAGGKIRIFSWSQSGQLFYFFLATLKNRNEMGEKINK
jgi:hypothetical protein